MAALKTFLSRWYVRLPLTVGILALWGYAAELSVLNVGRALQGLSLSVVLAAPFLIVLNLGVGAFRWQLLVQAYGAPSPRYGNTLHAYLVAGFFNTFLPANLGGDILRANNASRDFDAASTPYFLVLIERVLGLSGMFLLAGTAALLSDGMPPVYASAIIAAGALSGALALLVPLWARRVAEWLPHRLGTHLRGLPRLVSSPRLWLALGLSVVTQLLFAGGAFLLVIDVAAPTAPFRVFGAIPLALLSLYLPTFAGFGGREAAFAFALGSYAISEADATAASFAFGLAQLAVALLGGVAHGLRRLR